MFIHITITDDILYKMPTYITYTVQNIYSHNICILYKIPIRILYVYCTVQNVYSQNAQCAKYVHCAILYCTKKKIMILLQNGKDRQCQMCLVLLGDRFDSKLLGSFVRPKQLTINHEPISYFSDHLAK